MMRSPNSLSKFDEQRYDFARRSSAVSATAISLSEILNSDAEEGGARALRTSLARKTSSVFAHLCHEIITSDEFNTHHRENVEIYRSRELPGMHRLTRSISDADDTPTCNLNLMIPKSLRRICSIPDFFDEDEEYIVKKRTGPLRVYFQQTRRIIFSKKFSGVAA